MEWIEHIFAYFVMGNAAFILGFSVVILIYYGRRMHRHLAHIGMMALSFIMLILLVAGASNFRIFYEGLSRDIANLVLFIAMVLADLGLLKMWRARSGRPDGPMHVTQT